MDIYIAFHYDISVNSFVIRNKMKLYIYVHTCAENGIYEFALHCFTAVSIIQTLLYY